MTDTVEPITLEEREKTLQQFLDRLYINRQVCSLPQNYCRNNHLIDEAGLRLSELQAALSASEAREKRLQAELDALNDNGALHTAYLSGQRDAKERIAELEAREKKLKALVHEGCKMLATLGEQMGDTEEDKHEIEEYQARARQALGE